VNKLLLIALTLLLAAGLNADNLSREGFQAATLANGIPVYFKANPNNQVLALEAFLRGGSTLLTPETAGWEKLALTMLTRGSARYSYTQLKDLQWRTSSALTASASSFDGSSFGLVTLPASFDALFDAWADAWASPRWDPAEYDRVIQDAKLVLQQNAQEPYNRAIDELHSAMFAGHPYRASFDPTAASLAAVTLPKLRAWWESNLRSGRIVVIAVGAFDFPALKAKLDGTLGRLARADFVPTPVPAWTTPGLVKVVPFPDAGAVGYVRADFPVPAVTDPDSAALDLGFTVLNDILFDIVRAKYAACYSVWSRNYTFLSPYGSLAVYKTDRPALVKAYLDEAVGLLASGKALASQASASADGKGGIGAADGPQKAEYVALAQVLEFYKAKAINGFYEGQQTNGALAGQMATALLYRGDVKAYLDYAARVRAVTADDVVRVIRRYVQAGPKAWVVLAAPDLLQGVTEATFAPAP